MRSKSYFFFPLNVGHYPSLGSVSTIDKMIFFSPKRIILFFIFEIIIFSMIYYDIIMIYYEVVIIQQSEII